MTTPSKADGDALASFVDTVCGPSHLRVEQDFGGGFVRLRSTEAEKRQAAQDIRSTEDIVIELLRNARDAGARHIFLALARDENVRTVVVVDDGCGIPEHMQGRVFEPRVTSKLDTAHMDKWGMHGRGMALYSVSVNAREARVQRSGIGSGTSLLVRTDLSRLGEKTDQSTFPRFEVRDGVHVMRGPRNIVRTAAEFALEHRDLCAVYCGSATEVASTLYEYALATTTPSTRVFGAESLPLVKQLATATDPEGFARIAGGLGLSMSTRSARRILDGEIAGLPTLMERLEDESFSAAPSAAAAVRKAKHAGKGKDMRGLKIDPRDLEPLKTAVSDAYDDLAQRYFLESGVDVRVRVARDAITISIPVEKRP